MNMLEAKRILSNKPDCNIDELSYELVATKLTTIFPKTNINDYRKSVIDLCYKEERNQIKAKLISYYNKVHAKKGG